jgi:tRNA-2-methylthio-N6-dimethylallyladenosine synthase
MQRRHTSDHYRRLVDRLRAARPDLALASDFIVGFPGETEADFRATLKLVGDIGFAQAYSFKYSPRPGTPAAALVEEQVPEAVKGERLRELQALIGDQQRAFNKAQEGRELAVLFDRPGRREGQLWGRSPYMQAVHVSAPEALMGRVVPVTISRAHGVSLEGRLGQDLENAA